MLLNEIIKEVGMTKRAVKYYEEKGLLSVDKDSNGYRNYSMQDVKTLKKISGYRKLGIGIKDIQTLLEKDDKSILLRIYQEKLQEKILQDSELEALKQFIDDGNADKANEILDYQTVENAIESLLPGKEWGDYLKSHFKPFLNVRLKTLEQKQALRNILEYCDENGDFHYKPWDESKGKIYRSYRFDNRNSSNKLGMVSIIIDAVKPIKNK